ncbi:MAG TPA: hypothetical protein VGL42_12290 [Opitutaceae bacterium]|jgi:hypothetical protein
MNSSRLIAVLILPGFLASAAFAIGVDLQTPFGQMTVDYKNPVEVPANLFNPFKAQLLQKGDDHSAVATVSDDAVRAAVASRGLSGLVLAAAASDNRAIIGNEVFGVGDELSFTDDKGASAPLVSSATVVLKSISKQTLLLELTAGGESPRMVAISLRAFLAP